MPPTRSKSSKVLLALPKHLFGKHTTAKPRWKRRRAIPRPSPLGATCVTAGADGKSRTTTIVRRNGLLSTRKATRQDPLAAVLDSLWTSLEHSKRTSERAGERLGNLTSDIAVFEADARRCADKVASIRKRLEQARVR